MRVIVDWGGGPNDGSTVIEVDGSGRPTSQYAFGSAELQAFVLFSMTKGEIGREVRGMAPYLIENIVGAEDATKWTKLGVAGHQYKIVERLQDGDELILKVAYLGPTDDSPT